MNIQHSSKSADWRTPTEVLDAVKELFGGSISLDAASDENAQKRVGALRWLGAEFDALSNPWPEAESIFLNPPGGKLGKESQTKLFWNTLFAETGSLHTTREGETRMKHGHAVFLAFSLEALQTCQDPGYEMLRFPLCVPNKRLRFVNRYAPECMSHEEFCNELNNLPVYAPTHFFSNRTKEELVDWAKRCNGANGADLIKARFANSPSHANVIVYVPGYKDETKRFIEIFSRFGACR